MANEGLNRAVTQLESPYSMISNGLTCSSGSTMRHSTILMTMSIPKGLANASLAGMVLLLTFDLLAAIMLYGDSSCVAALFNPSLYMSYMSLFDIYDLYDMDGI